MSNVGLSMGPSGSTKGSAPKKKRHAGRAVVIGVLLIALIVAALGYAAWFFLLKAAPDYQGQGQGNVVVTVSPGQSITSIGQELQEKGVVKSSDAFVDAASSDSRAKSIPTGSFALREKMSGEAALALLVDPSSRLVTKIAVPEGARLSEVIAESAKVTGIPVAEFEAALKAGDLGLPAYAKGNAEGFLYPATYEVQPKSTATDILKQMVAKFNEVAAKLNLEQRAVESGRSPYDVVITASLLEGEGTPTDFPKIARVVDNRLAKGMPLQFDSTLNYATKSSNIQLSKEQLELDSPYNSYKNKGLPPTPIGQPGEAALSAALAPEAGDWLYFVTVDPEKKVTKFTASYEEFQTFVQELNANLKKQ